MINNLYALAKQLGELCVSHNIKIALAESCTGGSLSGLITEISGSSAWFNGAVVVYSNAAKVQLLNVDSTTLGECGAVSEPVAKEMAIGALEQFQADVALSITGVAGPFGGSKEKPVGTVCFALVDKKRGICESRTMNFTSGREYIRRSATEFAIAWLIQALDNAPL
ncbi:MAG: CinA family protein [Gammaproteobacteria bacterium]|nr:CinA family protein [Gammaproteobacteria bacterium]